MRIDEEDTRRMIDHKRGKAQQEKEFNEYVHIQEGE